METRYESLFEEDKKETNIIKASDKEVNASLKDSFKKYNDLLKELAK